MVNPGLGRLAEPTKPGEKRTIKVAKPRRGAVVVARLRFSNANALSSLTAQAGACSSSAYAAISKIIALQAIFAFMSFCLKNLLFLCPYVLLFCRD